MVWPCKTILTRNLAWPCNYSLIFHYGNSEAIGCCIMCFLFHMKNFTCKRSPNILIKVIWFAKSGLVHTKWQGTLFTTNQLLHQWTNGSCVCHYPQSTGLLFLGLFSWACLTCSSARVVFKWQWCEWQISTWLEITTRLAKRLGHQIGYCLWYLELKWASGETFWQVNFNMSKNPPVLWLPTTPNLHPYYEYLW